MEHLNRAPDTASVRNAVRRAPPLSAASLISAGPDREKEKGDRIQEPGFREIQCFDAKFPKSRVSRIVETARMRSTAQSSTPEVFNTGSFY
jgi:hypothetical protein